MAITFSSQSTEPLEYDLLVAGASVFCKPDPQTPAAFLRRDLAVKGGRIAALLEPGAATAPARVTHQAGGRVVLPGLINAHTHSYGQLCRTHLSDDILEAILPGIFSWSRRFDESMFGIATALQCADSLRHGVTTILDHVRLDPAALDPVLDAYASSGLRVVLAPQVSDRPFSESLSAVPASIRSAVRDWEAWPAPSIDSIVDLHSNVLGRIAGQPCFSLLVGPSTMDRCSPGLLERLAGFARSFDLGVHTHLLESRLQRAGIDPVELLLRTGLLTSRTGLAHGVHLLPQDIEKIAESGASVIHNPQSNLALGSGRCRPVELRRAGVNVGLGTDGFNCGGSQSVLDATKLAMILGRPEIPPGDWLTPADVWSMATEGGAAAIGLKGRVGVLAPDAEADFVVVRPGGGGHFDGPDLIDQFVFGGFGSGLEAVFVAGRQLTENGRMLSIDEATLQEEASRAYRTLLEGEAADSDGVEKVRSLLSGYNEAIRVAPAAPR